MSKTTKTYPNHAAKDLTKREHIAIQWLLQEFRTIKRKDSDLIPNDYITKGYIFEDAVYTADRLIKELNKIEAPNVVEDEK